MFNFAQNKELETLDSVPGNLKTFYEKKNPDDDKSPYVLKSDPVVAAAIGLATGLHEALTKERNVTKELKAQKPDLSALSEYGTDPTAIAEAVTKKVNDLQAQIKDGGNVKQQIEDMKREMTAAHIETLSQRDDTIQNLTDQLDDYMINTEIAQAATKFPGLNPELIAPFAKRHMKVDVDAETGKRTVMVLDAAGSTRYSMESPGDKASVGELLTDMSKQDDYMQLFPSDARRGANTNPGPGPSIRSGNRDAAKPSAPADKISRGLAARQHQGH